MLGRLWWPFHSLEACKEQYSLTFFYRIHTGAVCLKKDKIPDLVFPPAPKKGMVKFLKKRALSARCESNICKNKGPDQLHSNCAANQRLCFRFIDSAIPLLPKSKILSL